MRNIYQNQLKENKKTFSSQYNFPTLFVFEPTNYVVSTIDHPE